MDLRWPEMRRTMTLSEQLSRPDPAIHDFLGVPHDDADRRPSTLMDAIGRDGHAESGIGGIINWKPLRDRLRLRRAASAWTTTTPAPKPAATATNGASGNLSSSNSGGDRSSKYNYSPGEAAAAFSRTFSRAPSLRATPTFSRATSTRVGPTSATSSTRRAVADEEEEEEDDDNEDYSEEEEGRDDEEPAAKISLMALLEQTDNQWDDDDGAPPKNSAACVGDDDDDDGEAREEEMAHVCCVCMVRHKGAAFIPCGHTFCRLCSRELWVSRGNCPLCNGFIQEILDIF